MNIKTKIRIYKLLINRRIESDEIVSNYNDIKAKIYIDKAIKFHPNNPWYHHYNASLLYNPFPTIDYYSLL